MTGIAEIRRHSYTKKGGERGRGSHLSAEGVRLARRVGDAMGPFAKVVASDVPRTLETAVAMGFAVDEILPFPDSVEWDAVIGEIGWHALWETERPFAQIAETMASRPQTARMSAYYAARWLRAALADQPVLFVSHGQLMETGLVACLPEADHAAWGRPFAHCEGARLFVHDGAFSDVEFLRLPP